MLTPHSHKHTTRRAVQMAVDRVNIGVVSRPNVNWRYRSDSLPAVGDPRMFFASCLVLSCLVRKRLLSFYSSRRRCLVPVGIFFFFSFVFLGRLARSRRVCVWQFTTCLCVCVAVSCVHLCIQLYICLYTCIHVCIHMHMSLSQLKHFSGDLNLF